MAQIQKPAITDEEVVRQSFVGASPRKPESTTRGRYAGSIEARRGKRAGDAYGSLLDPTELLTRR